MGTQLSSYIFYFPLIHQLQEKKKKGKTFSPLNSSEAVPSPIYPKRQRFGPLVNISTVTYLLGTLYFKWD